MALQKEIWINDIRENLFANNMFLERATDHSQYVDNKTVHIPQAGSNPGVVKDRAVFPASISQRTDTELTYDLAEYSSNPILVRDVEDLQVSYDKRMSVMRNHIKKLGDVIANQTLYAWAPAGATRQVRTTGSAVGTALAPSATGTRNAITLADIASAKAILDKDNVPAAGRVLVIPSDMYNAQLLAIAEVYRADAYGSPNLPSGVVNRIHGFDIIVRPTVLVYDNTGTPVIKAVGDEGTPSSPATTDNLAALAYHPDYVSKAMGTIDVYSDEKNPVYYGDVISAAVMHGAKYLNTGYVGVAAIIQQ